MRTLDVVVFGPGRAGGSMAVAADRAGHTVIGLMPGRSGRVDPVLARFPVIVGENPPCDLLILAVPDDVIAGASRALVDVPASVVCHLSGFTSSDALSVLRRPSRWVGALHPVQSLPNAEEGADALAGSHAAISGDPPARELLMEFARSLGMVPFELDDSVRALHHAAAAAASNFVAAALIVSRSLADRAGVPVEAYERLTTQTIENIEADGVGGLTGPIARGDLGTVSGHLATVRRHAPELLDSYVAFVKATAALTPHRAAIEMIVKDLE